MEAMQRGDVEISWLRDRVERGDKPAATEMDAEGQEMRAMIARWKELVVKEKILYRRSKYGLQAVLPREMRAEVFAQLHGLAHVGGHLGRDRTYMKARCRTWWPGYKSDLKPPLKSSHNGRSQAVSFLKRDVYKKTVTPLAAFAASGHLRDVVRVAVSILIQ